MAVQPCLEWIPIKKNAHIDYYNMILLNNYYNITFSIGCRESWKTGIHFFIASNIPADTASTYASTSVQNHITEDVLPGLTKETSKWFGYCCHRRYLSHYQAWQTVNICYSTTLWGTINPGSNWFTKLYTCEEGEVHLRISVWHLLMNLKNNLFKNCWSGLIKNVRILIFTIMHCFKKMKKNTRRYHYFTYVNQKYWWYDIQFFIHRVRQTEIGNYGSFFPFYPTKTKKIRILKKWEKLLVISSYVPKTHIIWGLSFCQLGPFFALWLS